MKYIFYVRCLVEKLLKTAILTVFLMVTTTKTVDA
jgi:hypothetical protein